MLNYRTDVHKPLLVPVNIHSGHRHVNDGSVYRKKAYACPKLRNEASSNINLKATWERQTDTSIRMEMKMQTMTLRDLERLINKYQFITTKKMLTLTYIIQRRWTM